MPESQLVALVLPPAGPYGAATWIAAALFLASGVAISLLYERLHAARRRLEEGAVRLAAETERRRRAEEASLESEGRFHRLADSAPVLIRTHSADLRCIWFNRPWLGFVGRTLEQEVGEGWAENVHPDDRQACLERFRAASETNREIELEYRLRRHDGEYRWVRDRAVPMLDAAGELEGYIGCCVDITEDRRKMDQLHAVTESLSAPVALCGRDLRYQWVSRPLAEWVGRPAEEIVGRPIREILGETLFQQLQPRFERVLAGQQVEYEEVIELPGLGRRWVHGIYQPTRDTAGQVDGWVGVVLDIDRIKRTEEALLAADRRKDEFLATLAHELRNPLAPVRTSVSVLRASKLAPEPAWAAEVIERQVGHMARLLDDLLDLSRLTADKIVLHREPVLLAEVIANAIETSRPLIERCGHQLAWLPPREPIVLAGDPVRLTQVFTNLLNNAAKFTDPGGRLSIAVEHDPGKAMVTVGDSGIGLDPGDLERIFETFSQAKPADRASDGLGIGLSLARRIVELHDGSIEARSEGEGRGSEFRVRLPVSPAAPAETPAGAAAPQSAGARCRVLVVDDQPLNADSLAMVLEQEGHEVETAYDGTGALGAAERFRPDVVLLDIGMPRLDGYEVCRRLRQQPHGREMVVIALTGWSRPDDRERAREAGFDHHLSKPVETAHLTRLVASLAAGRPSPLES